MCHKRGGVKLKRRDSFYGNQRKFAEEMAFEPGLKKFIARRSVGRRTGTFYAGRTVK